MDSPILLSSECSRVLADIHDALMARKTEEETVLDVVCEKLLPYPSLRMAWIGIVEPGNLVTIKGVASDAASSLRGTTLSLADRDANNPIAECIRTGLPVWRSNWLTSARIVPFKTMAPEIWQLPAMFHPLAIRGRCIGVLCAIAKTAQGFDQDDHILLQVTALHTSLALGMLRAFSAEDERGEGLQLAAAVFDNSLEGILITDAHGAIQAANAAVTQVSGYGTEELIGKNPSIFHSGCHDEAFYAAMWDSIRSTGQWKGEIWNRRKDGELYPEWLSISTIRDEQGQVKNYIGIFIDITKQKEAETRLNYLAYHDRLTGLPNRDLFNDRLLLASAQAKRNHSTLAVLFIDLDHFKHVNDTFGHAKGDELLQQAAQRMAGCLRAEDTLARLGGDEFTVMMQHFNTENDVELVARKIIAAMKPPFLLGEHEMYISASIGISLYPDHGDNPTVLLKNADIAMYCAKKSGRDDLQFFRPGMGGSSTMRMEMERNLHRALEQKEFRLFYQPQIDLFSGRMLGVEALLRWQQPDIGMIAPQQFIPLAEETGLIIPLGEWVLRTACTQCKAWQQAGMEAIRVAVNLSAKQFRQANFSEMVADILSDTGLAPDCLELELTESIAMHHAEETVAMLRRLKDLGVQISIDDFGTGYSSLSQLKRFTIDRLKIGQTFVAGIAEDPCDAAIVVAIIAMAHSLGLNAIAEGVEMEDQLNFLKMHGCNEVQGFLLGRPMPAEEFVGSRIS